MQETERNAVTWGVYPGQEIIQSTIIEEESFLRYVFPTICPLSEPEQSTIIGTNH